MSRSVRGPNEYRANALLKCLRSIHGVCQAIKETKPSLYYGLHLDYPVFQMKKSTGDKEAKRTEVLTQTTLQDKGTIRLFFNTTLEQDIANSRDHCVWDRPKYALEREFFPWLTYVWYLTSLPYFEVCGASPNGWIWKDIEELGDLEDQFHAFRRRFAGLPPNLFELHVSQLYCVVLEASRNPMFFARLHEVLLAVEYNVQACNLAHSVGYEPHKGYVRSCLLRNESDSAAFKKRWEELDRTTTVSSVRELKMWETFTEKQIQMYHAYLFHQGALDLAVVFAYRSKADVLCHCTPLFRKEYEDDWKAIQKENTLFARWKTVSRIYPELCQGVEKKNEKFSATETELLLKRIRAAENKVSVAERSYVMSLLFPLFSETWTAVAPPSSSSSTTAIHCPFRQDKQDQLIQKYVAKVTQSSVTEYKVEDQLYDPMNPHALDEEYNPEEVQSRPNAVRMYGVIPKPSPRSTKPSEWIDGCLQMGRPVPSFALGTMDDLENRFPQLYQEGVITQLTAMLFLQSQFVPLVVRLLNGRADVQHYEGEMGTFVQSYRNLSSLIPSMLGQIKAMREWDREIAHSYEELRAYPKTKALDHKQLIDSLHLIRHPQVETEGLEVAHLLQSTYKMWSREDEPRILNEIANDEGKRIFRALSVLRQLYPEPSPEEVKRRLDDEHALEKLRVFRFPILFEPWNLFVRQYGGYLSLYVKGDFYVKTSELLNEAYAALGEQLERVFKQNLPLDPNKALGVLGQFETLVRDSLPTSASVPPVTVVRERAPATQTVQPVRDSLPTSASVPPDTVVRDRSPATQSVQPVGTDVTDRVKRLLSVLAEEVAWRCAAHEAKLIRESLMEATKLRMLNNIPADPIATKYFDAEFEPRVKARMEEVEKEDAERKSIELTKLTTAQQRKREMKESRLLDEFAQKLRGGGKEDVDSVLSIAQDIAWERNELPHLLNFNAVDTIPRHLFYTDEQYDHLIQAFNVWVSSRREESDWNTMWETIHAKRDTTTQEQYQAYIDRFQLREELKWAIKTYKQDFGLLPEDVWKQLTKVAEVNTDPEKIIHVLQEISDTLHDKKRIIHVLQEISDTLHDKKTIIPFEYIQRWFEEECNSLDSTSQSAFCMEFLGSDEYDLFGEFTDSNLEKLEKNAPKIVKRQFSNPHFLSKVKGQLDREMRYIAFCQKLNMMTPKNIEAIEFLTKIQECRSKEATDPVRKQLVVSLGKTFDALTKEQPSLSSENRDKDLMLKQKLRAVVNSVIKDARLNLEWRTKHPNPRYVPSYGLDTDPKNGLIRKVNELVSAKAKLLSKEEQDKVAKTIVQRMSESLYEFPRDDLTEVLNARLATFIDHTVRSLYERVAQVLLPPRGNERVISLSTQLLTVLGTRDETEKEMKSVQESIRKFVPPGDNERKSLPESATPTESSPPGDEADKSKEPSLDQLVGFLRKSLTEWFRTRDETYKEMKSLQKRVIELLPPNDKTKEVMKSLHESLTKWLHCLDETNNEMKLVTQWFPTSLDKLVGSLHRSQTEMLVILNSLQDSLTQLLHPPKDNVVPRHNSKPLLDLENVVRSLNKSVQSLVGNDETVKSLYSAFTTSMRTLLNMNESFVFGGSLYFRLTHLMRTQDKTETKLKSLHESSTKLLRTSDEPKESSVLTTVVDSFLKLVKQGLSPVYTMRLPVYEVVREEKKVPYSARTYYVSYLVERKQPEDVALVQPEDVVVTKLHPGHVSGILNALRKRQADEREHLNQLRLFEQTLKRMKQTAPEVVETVIAVRPSTKPKGDERKSNPLRGDLRNKIQYASQFLFRPPPLSG